MKWQFERSKLLEVHSGLNSIKSQTMADNLKNQFLQDETILIGRGWDLDKWNYDKRRAMQEVIPGLFLGPYSAAMKSKLNYLKKNGISHIVCVRNAQEAHFIKPNFEDHFMYLILEMNDSKNENIIQHFITVRNFINNAVANGGKVLVHSNTGVSRSAALVIAYLIYKYNISFKTAHEHVLNKRLCIKPNEGFVSQIKEYEVICQANEKLSDSSSVHRSKKRPFDEL